LVTSAPKWLSDRLNDPLSDHLSANLNGNLNGSFNAPSFQQPNRRFPSQIPTLIDGASQLEAWIRAELSIALATEDWDALTLAYPSQRDYIRDMRVRITHTIFQHPANPYSCHLIDSAEQALLQTLYERLQIYGSESQMPPRWQTFWQRFFQTERLAWSQINRDLGSIVLCCGPTDIDQVLAPVWQQQPVVLIGTALDVDKQATRYRAQLGLGEMTCLKFGPDRHHDWIQLYLPDRLPMPNTSQFKAAALQEIRRLLSAKNAAEDPMGERVTNTISGMSGGPTVVIVGDVPLRSHVASVLAAELGSRVQLESSVEAQGVLVTGWDYWLAHQAMVDPPSLLIITTLPIPSLENPLVAGRVATYKRRRQDWFKAYLLPEALSTLQQAIASVRSHKTVNGETSVVALLDNRVNYRSYGAQVITALSPAARSSYLDPSWFSYGQFSSAHTGIDQA
ncbi:MAG: helicase C-terminal domain-containing protein, partial [Phormidesmis sp.]